LGDKKMHIATLNRVSTTLPFSQAEGRLEKALGFWTLCCATAFALFSPASSWAAFPEKPLRIIVPFSPGGGTDLVARTLGNLMGQDLGQPVLVENKPGASTIIGTDALAKSAPDGYSMVIATLAHAVNPSIQAKLPYVQETAFAPIILIGRQPNVLVVNESSPFKSIQEIISAARANPGKYSFASQGSGTSAHLAGELFNYMAKIQITHIPYKGAAPALTDLLGSQVDMMFATASAVGGFVTNGKLRALAVTTSERSPTALLGKVPTVAETLPGYVAESWYGLFAPAGTPEGIVNRLNLAAKKASLSETFKQKIEKEGLIVNPSTPEEFDRYVKSEEVRWKAVVKSANIKAE
jgi:tripartite-type tricarboxylate transporter receptor subunit TctC